MEWKRSLDEDLRKRPHENQLGGWISLLFGILLLGFSAFASVPKLRAFGWVPGTAIVTATDMYERTGRGRSWCARIGYSYTVDGRTYKSRNYTSAIVSDVACNHEKDKIVARLAALPAGTVIGIHYDAAAPERAAIVVEGLKFFDYFLLLIAVIPLGLGVYMARQTGRLLRK